MKKTLLFTLPLLFLSLFINAQGNLQFNKAKLIGAQIDSVPTGKVWKIESVMPVGGQLSVSVNINGQLVTINSFMSQTASSPSGTIGGIAMQDIHPTKLPFWLPEGTTLFSANGLISLIEFNIIP